MSVEIKFQNDTPEVKPVKTYTGDVDTWPVGVYKSTIADGGTCLKCCSDDAEVLFVGGSGFPYIAESLSEPYVRISDNPEIASITFAGSMNYPDGKPEGEVSVADPEQLSDPTDLKVGDWIQWEAAIAEDYPKRSRPVQVVKVKDGFFADSADPDYDGWSIGGGCYTVVPAPKGGE